MAAAGYRFTQSLIRGIEGEKVTECAFVLSNITDGVSYFASPVELGPEGARKVNGYGTLSSFEQQKFKEAIPELQKNIQKGIDFVKNQK